MPSGDGTGPGGQGRLTGKGLGRCGSGRGQPQGLGMNSATQSVGDGRRQGRGRGLRNCFRNWNFGGLGWPARNSSNPDIAGVSDSSDRVEQKLDVVQSQIDSINQQLKKLEVGAGQDRAEESDDSD